MSDDLVKRLPCPFCGGEAEWNTRADAQAALYKVKREARNEALREAAKRMKEKADIESEYSPFNAACFDVAERAILALMEDKK